MKQTHTEYRKNVSKATLLVSITDYKIWENGKMMFN